MSRKKLSLGEKIALAATGNQEEEYPEDIEYETSAKVTELDEEYDIFKPAARSSLRTQNAQLLDEFDSRYSGEKISRKKIAGTNDFKSSEKARESIHLSSSQGSSEDEEDSEEELDADEASSTSNEQFLSSDNENEDEDETEGEEEEDDDENWKTESEEASDAEEVTEGESGMQTLSVRDKEAEIEKGKAVLNQIKIWDSLLEVRIRLQKMLLDCNRLPQTEMYEELISDISNSDEASNLTDVIGKSQEATKLLMHELLRFQEIMSEKNTETQKGLSKQTDPSKQENKADHMDEEITSEEDETDIMETATSLKRKRKIDTAAIQDKAKKMKLEEFTSLSTQSFNSIIPYRNQTIQKWNDKTQFAGGKFNRKSSGQQISTLRQIEQILSNKERLLKRTQVKRSKYVVIGDVNVENAEDGTQETNEEVFDDDDFYHQLLRELIERKTSNINDPTQLSRHWLELQKLRTKLKKKVDTKASKGRKIRYDVHSKLVNFMAPQDKCSMSATAMKELFGSLFGKTK